MNIELVVAGADEIPVLRRLMQLYLYDLGSLDGWDIGDDGTYGNASRIEGFGLTSSGGVISSKLTAKLAGFILTRAGTYFSGDSAHLIVRSNLGITLVWSGRVVVSVDLRSEARQQRQEPEVCC